MCPVDQNLEWRSLAFAQEICETSVNDERNRCITTVDYGIDLFLRLRTLNDVESIARREAGDEFPTFLGAVEIQYRGRYVINLEGRSIAEQQQLNEGRHNQTETPPFVAPELNELLDQYVGDAAIHRLLNRDSCGTRGRPTP